MSLTFRDWGTAQIILLTSLVRPAERLGLVALHFKEDGAIENKPTLAFELRDRNTNVFFYEVSLAMLGEALSKAGYRLEREWS